jgi:A/G-specific adenine glycosylase
MLRDAQTFGNRAWALSASTDSEDEAAALLAWYDGVRRDLPWRARRGEAADPYRVWISEIMLQQTTVAAVAPYFHAFVGRWPRIEDLAAADLDQVLHAWQGLGYYARARHLHACAQTVVARHAGVFPADEAALRLLPGVGDYTAAAIAAIAFDLPATAVDGNVLRVVARLHAVKEALPAARPRLVALARALTPAKRPGDFAQAMMDLGATVCTPRRPRCSACPWQGRCAAYRTGRPEEYPRRAVTAEKPVRRGVVFWLERADGAVLVRRRPSRGLLGGMMEFPSTPWRAAPWSIAEAVAVARETAAPAGSGWAMLPGGLRHTFTHFHLDLDVLVGRDAARSGAEAPDGRWCAPGDFARLALPTLMKKVVRLVAAAGERPGLPL